MRPRCRLAGALVAACAVLSAAGEEIPGGVTGVVYVQGDSLSAPWLPLPGAAVMAEAAVTDSGAAATEGQLTVGEHGLFPLIQVLEPGGVLRIISRSSSIHRLQATSERGDRVFSIALTIPGLEVPKTLHQPGMLTLTCTQPGHHLEIAHVLVTHHAGWAPTDGAGRYLVAGIPPGVRAIRVLHPGIGSATDSVVVTPARAAERNFYLIRADLPPAGAVLESR